MRRSWMLLTVSAVAGLGFVSHASAATVGFVPASPIAEVAYVFAADVTTEQTSWVHVKYRRVGGLPCAPSPESDPGAYLINNVRVSSGTQRVTQLATVASAGDYQVCAWLRNNSAAVLATQTSQISVRAPAGTLTLEFPDYVPAEQTVVVRVTGQTEVPRQVYAKVRPSGGVPCAPSPDSDAGSYVFYAHSVQGAFAVQNTLRLDQKKTWLVCGWLADDSGDISPLATASRTISSVPPVVASPPATLTAPR